MVQHEDEHVPGRLRVLGVMLALASALILSPPTNAAESFFAKVVGISDGDTITVLRNGREQVKVRLEGIDCPEGGQDFGRRAKEFTSSLTFAREVEVRGKALDRNGRLIARVVVDGRDVSVELVKAGFAWHFKRYSSDALLVAEEELAREARRGLWAMPNPVPPWDYRRPRRSP